MAQEIKIEETGCTLPTFERNRYFYGKPMTVRDFEAEQRYFIGKSRFINRLIHRVGIICGLQVSLPANFASDKPAIELAEGAALDCYGNLIVVSRSAKVEVKGTMQDGPNYLYLKYAECAKQPVIALANVSSCEETCCYSRIRETFEVWASPVPPTDASFSGKVTVSGSGKPVSGAKVEALQGERVKAATLTDDVGAYRLDVAAGNYSVRASGRGFRTTGAVHKSVAKDRSVNLDLTIELAEEPAAASLCHALAQDYYEKYLRVCPDCDDPKVLLAVLDINAGTPRLDVEKTSKYRSVVYSNPMLHDLLCDHLADFNNPHRTTAEQVKALQSINRVGNIGSGPYVSNVDLASDGTITIQPDAAHQKITIKTVPATIVNSVGPLKNPGGSKKFAREDHTHDLADGVVTNPKIADGAVDKPKLSPNAVTRVHLNKDVIENLLTSANGTINIKPDDVDKIIDITTTPAEDVSSVGPEKSVGQSNRFAREDHVHNLRINKRAPDQTGQFILRAGPNMEIRDGDEANELIISAIGGKGLDVPTGLVVFENMAAQDERTSPAISHGLEADFVAIIMALETRLRDRRLVHTGDLTELSPAIPAMIAVYTPLEGTFRILLKDRRESPPPRDPRLLTYNVRWWAIPKTRDVTTVQVPAPAPDSPRFSNEHLLSRLMINPGRSMQDFASDLRVELDKIEPQLRRLREDNMIRMEDDKLFPQ